MNPTHHLALLLTLASLLHAQTNPTTQPSLPAPTAPLPPKLTKIFDGKSLEGWSQIPADSWTIRDTSSPVPASRAA